MVSKALFIIHWKKVTLLVHDAILIEIWREQILPHLLKQTETSKLLSPLMVYTVVFKIYFIILRNIHNKLIKTIY